MKKNFIVFALFIMSALVSSNLYAQIDEPVIQTVNNSMSDNWYIGGQVGPNVQFMDKLNSDGTYCDGDVKVQPLGALYVGKNFTPYVGSRIRAIAGTFGTQNDVKRPYIEFAVEPTLNLTNLFGGQNNDRYWDLMVFGGAGYSLWFDDNETEQPDFLTESRVFFTTGVQALFDVTENIQLGASVSGRFGSDMTDNFVSGNKVLNHGWDYAVIPTVDIQYNFPNRFEQAELFTSDYVWGLNEDINNLKSNIKDLESKYQAEKAKKQEVVTQYVEKPAYSVADPTYVLFEINRADINQKMEPQMNAMLNYLKSNDLKIKIVGYADKKTGSSDYNYRLSERRARSVADWFTSRQIDSNRISIEFVGDHDQFFPVNNWNRAVVVQVLK